MSIDAPLTYNSTNKFNNLHIAGNVLTANPETVSVFIDGTTLAADTTAFVISASLGSEFFEHDLISTLPTTIYSNGSLSATFDFTLSASMGECLSGNTDNTLYLTMSSHWISGNKLDGTSTLAAASSVPWLDVNQTLTQTICTNNVPYTNLLAPYDDLQLCALEQSRKRLLGYL